MPVGNLHLLLFSQVRKIFVNIVIDYLVIIRYAIVTHMVYLTVNYTWSVTMILVDILMSGLYSMMIIRFLLAREDYV